MCACAGIDHAQDALPERVLLPQRDGHAALPARPLLQVVDADTQGKRPISVTSPLPAASPLLVLFVQQECGCWLQACPWLAKCPAGSASADISWGGFMALFFILGLLWLAYIAFSAYIRCVCASGTVVMSAQALRWPEQGMTNVTQCAG